LACGDGAMTGGWRCMTELARRPGGGSDAEPSFPSFPSVGFSGQQASGRHFISIL